ncbi:hypothetical protein Tco_0985190 [Tanacetum coccineum]
MAPLIVQIWARSGFDEIEEFFLWMLSCQALNNPCQHKWKHYFRQRPTAKDVGLRVADSRTGNHSEDDFTPLKTIRRLYSVFGRRSHLGFEGETSEPKGRVLKFEIECKDIAIRELRKKLEIAQKEKVSIQFNVDKFKNASKSLDKFIERQIVDNCKKGLGYNAVPPPYTGNFMPPTPNLSFTGLDEFVNKLVVENRKSDEEVSKVVRKSNDSPIIEEWVSDSEEEDVSQTKTEKKIVKPSIAKIV